MFLIPFQKNKVLNPCSTKSLFIQLSVAKHETYTYPFLVIVRALLLLQHKYGKLLLRKHMPHK